MASKLQSCFFLLAFVFYFDTSISIEVTTPKGSIVVKIGETVQLPCLYTTNVPVTSQLLLEWWFKPEETVAKRNQILYYNNDKLLLNGDQAARIKLLQDMPHNSDGSIWLENTQSTDSGWYFCAVKNYPDVLGNNEILINLTVLEPPSVPICKRVKGKTYISTDVTLACSSSVGRPRPSYKWIKTTESDTALPAGNMVQDSASGNLLLKNLTTSFTGTYECMATNEAGEEKCALSITVTYDNEAAVIAGAVIGTLLCLLLIGGGVGYFIWYKKKHPKVPDVGYNVSIDALAPKSTSPKEQNLPESHLLEKSNEKQDSFSTTKSEFNILV